MRIFIFLLITISVFSNNINEWEKQKKTSNKEWQEQKAEVIKDWEIYNIEIDRKWKKHISEIDKIWGEARVSTKKEWIKYSKDKKTYSRVNFDEKNGGYIELKTIESRKMKKLKVKYKLEKQLRAIKLEKDPYTNKNLLDGMVETTEKMEIKEDKAKNGKKIYLMRVPLKKNHFEIRRERYKNLIKEKALEIGVEPELVMAVVHSESSFNPKARSNAGAYGLMQLIPRYGALEGYEYLYKRKKIIKAEELYNPEKNIEYGTAYLKRLQTTYFNNIKDEKKRKYMVIAAYNWGPGIVKRKIENKLKIEKISKEKLYRYIRRHSPTETSNYLERVTSREKIYKDYF